MNDAPTTICGRDEVRFPSERKQQAADLMALAGEALLNGDRGAWQVLYMASKQLETLQ